MNIIFIIIQLIFLIRTLYVLKRDTNSIDLEGIMLLMVLYNAFAICCVILWIGYPYLISALGVGLWK